MAFGGIGNVGDLGTLVVKLRADATSLTRGLDKSERDLKKSTERMTKGLKRLGAAAGTAFTGIAAVGVNQFAKFDKALTQSTAIMTDLSETGRKEMADLAKSISANGITSAENLAESYFFLSSAGLDLEKQLASLSTVERFATAGQFDMAKATDLLTDAQAALGVNFEDTQKHLKAMTQLSDQLVLANVQSNASVEQFSEALTNDGAVAARQFGMSLSELLAVLNAYASTGAAKGAQAGNLIGRATRLLTQAARENADQFEKHNIPVIDETTGEYHKFIDIIASMEVAFKDMTKPARAAALEQLGFATLAQKSITPLIGMSEAMRGWNEEQKQATGFTKNVASKQLEAFSSQFVIMKNRINILFIEIGKKLAPALLGLNKLLGDGAGAADEVTKKGEELGEMMNNTLVPAIMIAGDLIQGANIAALGFSLALNSVAEALLFIINTMVGTFKAVFESIVRDINKGVENIVKTLNKIPGINIEDPIQIHFEMDLPGPKKIEDALNVARSTRKILVEDLQKNLDGGGSFSQKFAEAMEEGTKEGFSIIEDGFGDLELPELTDDQLQSFFGDGAIEKVVTDEMKRAAESEEASNAIKEAFERSLGNQFGGFGDDSALAGLLGMDESGAFGGDSPFGGNGGFGGGGSGGLGGFGGFGFGDPDGGFARGQDMINSEIEQAEEVNRILEELGEKKLDITKEVEEMRREAIENNLAMIKDLELQSTQNTIEQVGKLFGGLSSIAKDFAGEQSGIYKAMFAVEKAMAVATAIVNIQRAMSSAAASMPFPANLGAIATVVAQGASIVSTIKSTTMEIRGNRMFGGNVEPGFGYEINEAGREVFVPTERGKVIPHDQLVRGQQGEGGGLNVNIEVINEAGVEVEIGETERSGDSAHVQMVIKKARTQFAGEIRAGRGELNQAFQDTFDVQRGRKQ